ncbi:MAG: hypothetical protein M3R36_08090 [Bacteroidota bacterium]|nr:hypothetical protein [Bacteroidota bacterium]
MNPLNFFSYLPFFLRKKFTEKYIIIESDDWGLERALSVDSINYLRNKYGENKFSRWTFDSLETSDDLNELFGLLENFKNKFEHPPIITANFITHNIDYSDKENLNFIPISKGFNIESEDVRNIYKQGIRDKHIFPQLHGYSHYNLARLRKYFFTEEGMEASGQKFLGGRSTIRGNFSFLQGEMSEENSESDKIKDAAEEFNNFFGFYSKSVIPPAFIFDLRIMNLLKENNIALIQSSNRLISTMKRRYGFPYFQKRKGFYWSVRNARLDPHPEYKFNHEQCLKSIEKSFENKSPAVIDFHRVNFAGRYNPQYRNRTIKELKLLFDNIYKKWPDTKFIHSQKLYEILWQQETK